MLQRGVSMLGDKLKLTAGGLVTYSRGPQTFVATAVVSLSDYEIVDGSQVVTSVTSFDFQFVTSEMLFGATAVVPAVGDRIADVQGKFEVMGIGSKPCFEHPDSNRILTIVHTKKVK